MDMLPSKVERLSSDFRKVDFDYERTVLLGDLFFQFFKLDFEGGNQSMVMDRVSWFNKASMGA